MEQKQYLKSAAVLSFGGIAAKGIGAIYRVSLANLLGGYGMGLYQMAYPLFCVLLTFSSAGIPSAFSKLIARESARGRNSDSMLVAALKLFALIGLCGTAAMCLFAPRMSLLQGERGLVGCYLMLAPSVFLVALIAVLRGYFQGKNDMRPTAVSEIVEQLIKAGLGLALCQGFASDPVSAVSLCLLAVTVSEAAALGYLFMRLKEEPRGKTLARRKSSGSEILYAALPVMAATGLLPLSQTADSVLIVRLLRGRENAVALYGLFSGSALSLVNLPATLCYGLAASAIPGVAQSVAVNRREEGRDRAVSALCFTLLLSLPCALGLFLLAKPIVRLLYPGLNAFEAETLVALLRLLSVSAVTLAGTDTLAACLVGMDRAGRAALSMLVAVLLKFALEWLLIGRLSITGAAIAANACYLVAFFLDLFYTLRKTQRNRNADVNRTRRNMRRSLRRRAPCAQGGGRGDRPYGRTHSGTDA